MKSGNKKINGKEECSPSEALLKVEGFLKKNKQVYLSGIEPEENEINKILPKIPKFINFDEKYCMLRNFSKYNFYLKIITNYNL